MFWVTDDESSSSGPETESDNEDTGTSETGGSPGSSTKNSENVGGKQGMSKRQDKKVKPSGSDSSDTEMSEESYKKNKKKAEKLPAVAHRHSKVFFENDDGNIFSIYRCLLHSKKVCLNYFLKAF